MSDLSGFGDLNSCELNNFLKTPPSTIKEQSKASKELFVFAYGSMKIGVWECAQGQFAVDRNAVAENCHIILGCTRVENETTRTVRKITGGDLPIFLLGCKGKRSIRERLRKLYILSDSCGSIFF